MSINFIPGREVPTGTVVDVYRNLNEQKKTGRVVWSVRAREGAHKGRVVGHATDVVVTNASTHVGCGAQKRIAAGAPREVHAWVTGTLTAATLSPVDGYDWNAIGRRVTYRPHQAAEFRYVDTGAAFNGAALVAFNEQGMWVEA